MQSKQNYSANKTLIPPPPPKKKKKKIITDYADRVCSGRLQCFVRGEMFAGLEGTCLCSRCLTGGIGTIACGGTGPYSDQRESWRWGRSANCSRERHYQNVNIWAVMISPQVLNIAMLHFARTFSREIVETGSLRFIMGEHLSNLPRTVSWFRADCFSVAVKNHTVVTRAVWAKCKSSQNRNGSMNGLKQWTLLLVSLFGNPRGGNLWWR